VLGTRPGVAPDVRALTTGDLNGDGLDEVVACSDSGQIAALSAAGEKLWTWTGGEQSAIHCIVCAALNSDGRCEVAYGRSQATLVALSSAGEPMWSVALPQFRGIASDVMTLAAAQLDDDKGPELVAGCKSWQYFAFEGDGKQLWQNVIYAHSATVCRADDFDGDGKDETLAGNAYYRVNLIDHDGKRMWLAPGNIGPEQTAASSADVDADGRPEVLVGTDGGDLYCYDGDGSQLWGANLGDKVTRVIPVDLTGDAKPELACTAESANVYALNADGTVLWRTALPDGASDLAVQGSGTDARLLAAAGSAGLAVLDGQGRLIGIGATDGRAKAVAAAGGLAIASTSTGKVEAVEVR